MQIGGNRRGEKSIKLPTTICPKISFFMVYAELAGSNNYFVDLESVLTFCYPKIMYIKRVTKNVNNLDTFNPQTND